MGSRPGVGGPPRARRRSGGAQAADLLDAPERLGAPSGPRAAGAGGGGSALGGRRLRRAAPVHGGAAGRSAAHAALHVSTHLRRPPARHAAGDAHDDPARSVDRGGLRSAAGRLLRTIARRCPRRPAGARRAPERRQSVLPGGDRPRPDRERRPAPRERTAGTARRTPRRSRCRRPCRDSSSRGWTGCPPPCGAWPRRPRCSASTFDASLLRAVASEPSGCHRRWKRSRMPSWSPRSHRPRARRRRRRHRTTGIDGTGSPTGSCTR